MSWIDPQTLEYAPQAGLSFASQTLGEPGSSLKVTITNGGGPAETVGTATVGGDALHLTGLTVAGTDPGDYKFSASGCASIAAQSTCTITVTFTAQAPGDRPATLEFSSDDPARTGVTSIPLDGKGLLRATSSSVNCGRVRRPSGRG